MRKILVFLLVAVMCTAMCSCSGIKEIEPGFVEFEDSSTIKITEFLCEDGKKAYVFFEYTNNGDSSLTMQHYADVRVFQNGVMLDSNIAGFSGFESGNVEQDMYDAILPGTTITTAIVFELENDSPVVVQLCDHSPEHKPYTKKTFTP